MRVNALQRSFFGGLGLGILCAFASWGCRPWSVVNHGKRVDHAPAPLPFVGFVVAMSGVSRASG